MSTPARHSDSDTSPPPPFFPLFFLDLHGDATPPAKATRVTHSGELITPPVPPLAAFEDDTYFVCVRMCV